MTAEGGKSMAQWGQPKSASPLTRAASRSRCATRSRRRLRRRGMARSSVDYAERGASVRLHCDRLPQRGPARSGDRATFSSCSDPQRQTVRTRALRRHAATPPGTPHRSRKMNTHSASPASDRMQTNIDTFIAPTPEAGGITLRPFSAGTLTICWAAGNPGGRSTSSSGSCHSRGSCNTSTAHCGRTMSGRCRSLRQRPLSSKLLLTNWRPDERTNAF